MNNLRIKSIVVKNAGAQVQLHLGNGTVVTTDYDELRWIEGIVHDSTNRVISYGAKEIRIEQT